MAVEVSASVGQTRVVGLAGPNPADPKLAVRLPEWCFDSRLDGSSRESGHVDARANASTLALRFDEGAELKLPRL